MFGEMNEWDMLPCTNKHCGQKIPKYLTFSFFQNVENV